MRHRKTLTALIMLAAPSSALACEWDGGGGHRFFAFSGMYKGGAESAAPATSGSNSAAAAAGSASPAPTSAQENSSDKSKNAQGDTEQVETAPER